MEPLFDFIGQYWWIAFPLVFGLSAVGRGWERGARQRHKRRLEVIAAKSELKAAQAAARSKPVTASGAAAPATTAAAGAATQAAQLEGLFAAHDEIAARWLDYELDVAKVIAFPAMSDGRQPLTAAFLRAKRVADGLRPASSKARLTAEQLAEYRNAVTDFEVAFDVAERDARRIKDSSFSESERKRLDTAKQLLSVAIDQAATPAERQLAYRRVRQELDGLILLSDDAVELLEEKVALEITTGTVPQVPAAPAATTRPSTTPPPAAGSGEPAAWPVPARHAPDTGTGRVIRPKSHP